MAGHSHAKTVAARKEAQGKKKSKHFSKLIRQINVALREGGDPDPESNPKLRAVLAAANKANLPKERIDNAIKKFTSDPELENYEEIRYEGFGPFGLAFIVEALTDNRNRTASDIRTIFSKNGGSLGETGGVTFLFEKIGKISYDKDDEVTFDKLLEASLELDIQDCADNCEHEMIELWCKVELLHHIAEKTDQVLQKNAKIEIIWRPYDARSLNLEEARKVSKFIDALEDNDDVQEIFYNGQISSNIKTQLEGE